jgi:hypothetical protein
MPVGIQGAPPAVLDFLFFGGWAAVGIAGFIFYFGRKKPQRGAPSAQAKRGEKKKLRRSHG